MRPWVVALEAKLLLGTSKQGGGSGAWYQGLRRTVAVPGRVEHAGVGTRRVAALCLWPAGELGFLGVLQGWF